MRNWSFDTLEREVTVNLVYREFVRVGLNKVPDAKTLARIAQALGGEVIEKLAPSAGRVGARVGCRAGAKNARGHDSRRCDIVLYLAIFLKTVIVGLQYAAFAELVLDS